MGMKLYGTITANVQRAILPLFEAEVDIDNVLELNFMDLFKDEQKSPEYLAKQPFGQLPCLEDGDFLLFESRAIARYFAEKYQGQGVPLLDRTLKERAIINQWIEVESKKFDTAIGSVIVEMFLCSVTNTPLDEALKSTGVSKLKPVLDVYEVQLSKHKYIAGDEYSLADASHTPHLDALLKSLKVEVFTDDHPHVLAWAEDLISRPAFQKVLELNAKWLKQQT